ncbi:hypothetical protein [Ottowia thiooxydans]|nr:hypothetical protein [Ottowia thiooxydans]
MRFFPAAVGHPLPLPFPASQAQLATTLHAQLTTVVGNGASTQNLQDNVH